jgi:hypothetical protein
VKSINIQLNLGLTLFTVNSEKTMDPKYNNLNFTLLSLDACSTEKDFISSSAGLNSKPCFGVWDGMAKHEMYFWQISEHITYSGRVADFQNKSCTLPVLDLCTGESLRFHGSSQQKNNM